MKKVIIMERAKVIIHMYVSIDGKFQGQYGLKESGEYYGPALFKMSNANANGSATMIEHATHEKDDFSEYPTEGIDYSNYLPELPNEKLWVASFDRHGKLDWQTPYWDQDGFKMRVIEAVTKQASPNYLAFLRSKNIPYIVCGDKDFDLKDLLIQLKKHYKIDPLVVSGGAIINGVFLRQHLVDELSLVVAPHINGNDAIRSSFDTMGHYVDDTFDFTGAERLDDGGVHLHFKKVNK